MTLGKILITGARAPVALHFARLLNTNGNEIFLGDSFSHPISCSSDVPHTYFSLPEPRFNFDEYGFALEKLVANHEIDLVIPTCEEVFYLSCLWPQRKIAARLFAPDFKTLRTCHNKFEFIKCAQTLDLPVPETHLIKCQSDLMAFQHSCNGFVFKPVWSRFASEVILCPPNLDAKRLDISPQYPWVAQRYVHGMEICTYAFVKKGKLRACASYHPQYRAGRGAGVFFRPVHNPNITQFVQKFAAQMNFTGNLSFDFIEKPEGELLPIECNPRATSGLHYFTNGSAFNTLFKSDAAPIEPDIETPLASHLAMLVYGAPRSLSPQKWRRFAEDFQESSDILDWQGDKLSKVAQFKTFAEILGIAFKNKISPQQAATRDIEWNGEPI